MRKITQAVCSAFEARRAYASGNSSTDGEELFLHGNKIARHTEKGLEISNAGWSSNTTKERLNGLRGVSISQRKGVWYLNGKEWDGSWVLVSEYNANHA